MGLLSRIRENRETKKEEKEAIQTVVEAKKDKLIEEEAQKLADELGVDLNTAKIYLRKQQDKKEKAEKRQHLADAGKRFFDTMGKWAEGADTRLIESKERKKESEKSVKRKKEEFDFAKFLGEDIK